MRLVSPEQQREAARQRAASRSPLPSKRPKKSLQREIAQAIARENEYRAYVLLSCHHYETKESIERNTDGRHPGMYFCEACFDNSGGGDKYEGNSGEGDIYERMENCWREVAPMPIYKSDELDGIPF